jgi:flagellar basal body rod protein FlgG
MAQKKLPKLDQPSKKAIHDAAKTLAGSQALAELATRNLAESDTNAWRRVSQEHKEIICYRIRGGELLTAI